MVEYSWFVVIVDIAGLIWIVWSHSRSFRGDIFEPELGRPSTILALGVSIEVAADFVGFDRGMLTVGLVTCQQHSNSKPRKVISEALGYAVNDQVPAQRCINGTHTVYGKAIQCFCH